MEAPELPPGHQSKSGKIFLVVPAFNTGDILSSVIQQSIPFADRIVIVNDGSDAKERPVFDALAALPGVTVINHAENQGKGVALVTGINGCLQEMGEDDFIITIDGDGQHDPENIRDFIDVAENNPGVHLVLGERKENDKMPAKSRLGNKVARMLFRLQFGSRVFDTQTGYRMLSRKFARLFVDQVRPGRYETEMKMLILGTQVLEKIHSVTVRTIYFDGNKGTSFRALPDSFSILRLFLKYGAVSIASFVIDYVLFLALLYGFGIVYIYANIIARCVSAVSNFAGHKYFSFGTKGPVLNEAFKYSLAVLNTIVLATLLLYFAVSILGAPSVIAKPVVDAIVFILNFIILNRLVFSEKKLVE